MSLRLITVAALLVVALTFTAASAAKEFKPGDLRICNGNACVTITDQKLLDALGSFIYMEPQPAIVRRRGWVCRTSHLSSATGTSPASLQRPSSIAGSATAST
jgi:hypothetical protein